MLVSETVVLEVAIFYPSVWGKEGLVPAVAWQVPYWETHLKLALILLGCFIKAI